MNTIRTATRISGGMALLLMAQTVLAQSTSPLEQYWATFGEGDIAEDVPAVLDAAALTILDTTLNDTEVLLEWVAATDTWELTIDDILVADVVTDTDEWDRPTFTAVHDGEGVPMFRGFADVDNNGVLVIEWDEFGLQAIRMQVADGVPVGMATCICGGTGGTVTRECTTEDCNTAEQCREGGGGVALGYCKWKATSVGGTPN